MDFISQNVAKGVIFIRSKRDLFAQLKIIPNRISLDLCIKQGDSVMGMRYEFTCPAGCARITGRLWGTLLYKSDSYICPAAIHAGVIAGTLKF